jgi:hypothetical protein
MATLLEMRDSIEDDINRFDLSGQVNAAINRAITYYSKKPFWFTEAVLTYNTAPGQKAVDMSSYDIQKLVLVQATVNSTKFVLVPKPYTFIAGVDTGDFTGYPEYWAWFSQKIWLYPTPNDVYTITLSYHKKYDDLDDDADTNDFTENANALIEARARWWMYTHIIQDAEQANVAKEEELEELDCLNTKTEGYAHMPTGLQPTVF